MLDAKSMYRGGEIFSAASCDYSSAKELGLICLFCAEPVFLCSGGSRVRLGKKQVISAYFSHYGYSLSAPTCEKRALSFEGKEKIQQMRVEAKNQRLKLYNQYLWEIIADDWEIKSHELARVPKILGYKKNQAIGTRVHEEWKMSADSIHEHVGAALKQAFNLVEEIKAKKTKGTNQLRSCESNNLRYFQTIADRGLHFDVCNEICCFLASPLASYAFQKIFQASTLILADATAEYIKVCGKKIEAHPIELVASYPPQVQISYMIEFLVATCWLQQIQSRLSN